MVCTCTHVARETSRSASLMLCQPFAQEAGAHLALAFRHFGGGLFFRSSLARCNGRLSTGYHLTLTASMSVSDFTPDKHLDMRSTTSQVVGVQSILSTRLTRAGIRVVLRVLNGCQVLGITHTFVRD